MTLVAGIDSSTQRTTVEIRDLETGRVVGRGSAAHPRTMHPDHPGRSEADPEAWWRACGLALEEALAAAEREGALAVDERIAAVSVAAHQHGMVALDVARQVIRPAKLGNDTETAADAAWLIKQMSDGAPGWASATGSVPDAAFTITKLSWLHRSEPDAWDRLAHVLLPHDWITYRFTGEMTTDRGDASGTGYWSGTSTDQSSNDGYRFDVLSIVDSGRDWSHLVPRVLGPTDSAGVVVNVPKSDLARRLQGAVVAVGTGDNMAVALGTGMSHGDVAISIGPSVTAFAVSDEPVVDPTGAIAGFADATGRHLPLVRPDLPGATETLARLRSDVGREDVARASMEAVACAALDAVDLLRAEVSHIERVLLVGDGSHSLAMCDTLAGLSELPVEVTTTDSADKDSADKDSADKDSADKDSVVEPAAAGACVQAAVALTHSGFSDVVTRWGLRSRVTLDPGESDQAGRRATRDAHAELRREHQG